MAYFCPQTERVCIFDRIDIHAQASRTKSRWFKHSKVSLCEMVSPFIFISPRPSLPVSSNSYLLSNRILLWIQESVHCPTGCTLLKLYKMKYGGAFNFYWCYKLAKDKPQSSCPSCMQTQTQKSNPTMCNLEGVAVCTSMVVLGGEWWTFAFVIIIGLSLDWIVNFLVTILFGFECLNHFFQIIIFGRHLFNLCRSE